MSEPKLPARLGLCVYCHLPLYAWAPLASSKLPALAHVGCEVDAHRRA